MNFILNWRAERKKISNLYREEKLTLREIAKIYKTSHVTICKRLSTWKILRRGSGKLRQTGRPRKSSLVQPHAGQRFGKLTVVGKHPILYPMRWLCQCECSRIVNLTERQLGNWRSCGCAGRVKRGRKRKVKNVKSNI